MTYLTPIEANINVTSGIDQLMVYVAQQVPIFFPTLLIAFFLLIFFSGMQLGKRQEGREQPALWFMLASFMTAILAGIFFVIPLINGTVLGIALAFAGVGALWFFNSRGG